MADEQASQAEPPSDGDTAEDSIFDQPPGRDWLLVLLNDWARYDLNINVTLYLKGTAITGQIISGRRYLEHTADDMAKATSNASMGEGEKTVGEVLSEAIRSHVDVYPERKEGESIKIQSTYIHLENARVFLPGAPLAPANGMLWRGKLEEVDGFSMGVMQSSPAA